MRKSLAGGQELQPWDWNSSRTVTGEERMVSVGVLMWLEGTLWAMVVLVVGFEGLVGVELLKIWRRVSMVLCKRRWIQYIEVWGKDELSGVLYSLRLGSTRSLIYILIWPSIFMLL